LPELGPETTLIPPFFAVPISAGKCTLEACKTYLSLDDVLALNELVAVEALRDRIALDKAKRESR